MPKIEFEIHQINYYNAKAIHVFYRRSITDFFIK